MPSIPLNGTMIYYEMEGFGQPIVFIHGYSSSHHIFEPQLEYFGKRCQVVVLDLRGNGRSGKLNAGIVDIIEKQCEDVRLLLDMLYISKAVIVGCASGGLVAQRLALRYPELVEALVLVDCESSSPAFRRRRHLEAFMEGLGWLTSFMPGGSYSRSLSAVYSNWAMARRIMKLEAQMHRPAESLKQRIAYNRICGIHPDKARRDLPVLCVAGRNNEWGLKTMQENARSFPWAQTAIIEDAIYPSQLCQPLAFNRLLLDFLRGNDDDSGQAASIHVSGRDEADSEEIGFLRRARRNIRVDRSVRGRQKHDTEGVDWFS
jgi:pimeloyl-ACP methyl ester carboxylesterase